MLAAALVNGEDAAAVVAAAYGEDAVAVALSAHGEDAAVVQMALPAVVEMAGSRPLCIAIISGGISGLGAAIRLQRAGERFVGGSRLGGGRSRSRALCLQSVHTTGRR